MNAFPKYPANVVPMNGTVSLASGPQAAGAGDNRFLAGVVAGVILAGILYLVFRSAQ